MRCGAGSSGWRFLPHLMMTLSCSLLLSGCGNLFFLPSKTQILTPDQIGLAYDDVYLPTEDGERLHGWLLKAKTPLRGTVYFLHGNAENISTHIASVMWLPDFGYQVFLLDYRGYGLSTGEANIPGALADIETGYRWLLSQEQVVQQPLFVLGQSLGASLTTTFAGQIPDLKDHVRAVILDAPFTSFRGIVREKLNAFWPTWAFQYPLSWLVPGRYDPVDFVKEIAPTPLLVIHSHQDEVIPFHHGEDLFAAAAQPKQFLQTETRHIGTFGVREYREYLLRFIEDAGASMPDTHVAVQQN